MTPDEKFLVKVYKTATEKGNPHQAVNYHSVAKALGQKETAVKNIIKHLAQANFVRKIDETSLCLTERGCNLVLELIDT